MLWEIVEVVTLSCISYRVASTESNNYDEFKSEDKLDITSFSSIKIIDLAKIVQKKFSSMGKKVDIKPSIDTDTVQQNSKNIASKYLLNWWTPSTSLDDGIEKVFKEMYQL